MAKEYANITAIRSVCPKCEYMANVESEFNLKNCPKCDIKFEQKWVEHDFNIDNTKGNFNENDYKYKIIKF